MKHQRNQITLMCHSKAKAQCRRRATSTTCRTVALRKARSTATQSERRERSTSISSSIKSSRASTISTAINLLEVFRQRLRFMGRNSQDHRSSISGYSIHELEEPESEPESEQEQEQEHVDKDLRPLSIDEAEPPSYKQATYA